MIDNETLILIMYIIISILSGVCIGLLDSRNYWREKWKQDEEFLEKFWSKEDFKKE